MLAHKFEFYNLTVREQKTTFYMRTQTTLSVHKCAHMHFIFNSRKWNRLAALNVAETIH